MVVRTLINEGVPYIAAIPGHGTLGLSDALQRVSAPSEVRPALERAFAASVPAVVEVMVERTYPLSGSPAVGWWDVPVPTYLKEQRARYERERLEEQ